MLFYIYTLVCEDISTVECGGNWHFLTQMGAQILSWNSMDEALLKCRHLKYLVIIKRSVELQVCSCSTDAEVEGSNS
jgi:hypothetical protein